MKKMIEKYLEAEKILEDQYDTVQLPVLEPSYSGSGDSGTFALYTFKTSDGYPLDVQADLYENLSLDDRLILHDIKQKISTITLDDIANIFPDKLAGVDYIKTKGRYMALFDLHLRLNSDEESAAYNTMVNYIVRTFHPDVVSESVALTTLVAPPTEIDGKSLDTNYYIDQSTGTVFVYIEDVIHDIVVAKPYEVYSLSPVRMASIILDDILFRVNLIRQDDLSDTYNDYRLKVDNLLEILINNQSQKVNEQ